MEIKEILEILRRCTYGNEVYLIKEYGATLLLDYITNLQQELEEYKDTETYSKRFLYKANKDRLNANLELVKENERLKTKMKEQSLLLIDYQDMEQKITNLQQENERLKKQVSEYQDEIFARDNNWYDMQD